MEVVPRPDENDGGFFIIDVAAQKLLTINGVASWPAWELIDPITMARTDTSLYDRSRALP